MLKFSFASSRAPWQENARMDFRRVSIVLITSFVLMTSIPFCMFIAFLKLETDGFARENVAEHLDGLAEKGDLLVQSYMRERISDLRLVARMMTLPPRTGSVDLGKSFGLMRTFYGSYCEFFVLDPSGGILFSEGGFPSGPGAPSLLKGSLDGGEHVSDVFLYSNERFPAVVVTVPVRADDGALTGVVGAVVDFRTIDSSLQQSGIGRTGEVYLVNRDGFFITGSRLGAKVLIDRIPASDADRLGRRAEVFEHLDYRGKRVFCLQRALLDGRWFIVAEQDMEEAMGPLAGLGSVLIAMGGVSLSALVLMAVLVSRRIVRFLERAYRHEREMEFLVMQKERLAAMGLLTAGIAHEINTPLANALLYTQMVQRELGDADAGKKEKLSVVEEEIRQGGHIVHNLLALSRQTEAGSADIDVGDVLSRLLDLTEPVCRAHGVSVSRDIQAGLPRVRADASALQQVFTNIMANALDAMPDGGALKVASRHSPVLGKIIVDITDSGVGIPAENIPHIFDPFFTTKKHGESLGLGLFMSYEMVRRMGGNIRVVSETDPASASRGTMFSVELPAKAEAPGGGKA